MCFRFLRGWTWVAIAAAVASLCATCAAELKVCADPDALPFSNVRKQGFENRIAGLLARELHTNISYTWQRMGRGFVRDVLNKSECDVLLGIPSSFRAVLTTEPYYRSSYVFVARSNSPTKVHSFDDPALRRLRIGVQTVGEQYVPPAQALARRGMLANLKVFPSTGSERDAVLQSVLDGRLDLAVVWGPEAGYFNRTHGERLSITPVEPEVDIPALPMTFMISMGVRKGNVALRNRLNAFLERDRPQIQRVLRAYGVPLLPIGNLETAQARGGE